MDFNQRDLGDGNFLTASEIAEEFKIPLEDLVNLLKDERIDGIEGADCWFTTRQYVLDYLLDSAIGSVRESLLRVRVVKRKLGKNVENKRLIYRLASATVCLEDALTRLNRGAEND